MKCFLLNTKNFKGIIYLFQSVFLQPMINSSTDKFLQQISRRVSIDTDECTTLKKIIGKKEMLIEEADIICFGLNRRCREPPKLTSETLLKLRVTQDTIFPSSHAWAFQKRAPYLYFINKHIMRLHENGLLMKWSEYLRYSNHNLTTFFDGHTIVDNGNLGPKAAKFDCHFVLWIFGIGFSCLGFLLESAVNIIANKQKVRKRTEDLLNKI